MSQARPIDTQRIIDLYRGGATMQQIAAQFEVGYRLVHATLHQAGVRIRRRGPRPPGTAPGRHVSWRRMLLAALDHQPTVVVLDAVISHLSREPTRAEITAARRAAHRLADTTHHLQLVKVATPGPSGPRDQLVLQRQL